MMRRNFLIGIIFFVLCLFLYLFHQIYADARENAIAELNSRQLIIARQAQTGIENYFIHITNFLSNICRSVHVTHFDDQGRNEIDFALSISPEAVTAITRVDASGRIAYTTPPNPGAIGSDISNQKHIQKIMETHRPIVSDVFTAVQGYRAIALHVPVFENNEFLGTLAVLIDFLALSKRFLEEIRLGETGYAWMTSREGIELYCPVPGHTGKSVFENCKDIPTIVSMADKMVKGEKGVATYTFDRVMDRQTEKVKQHAVYLPIKILDSFWTVVVASSEGEVLANLADFRNKILLVVGLLLLTILLFSYYGMKVRGMARYVAELEQAENAIIKERDFISKVLYWIDSLVVVVDTEGYIFSFNRASEQLSGYRFEEVRNRPFWDTLLPPDEREGVKKTVKDVLHKDLTKDFQNHWVTRAGHKRLIHWNNSILPKADGSIDYILCTGLDITERHKAEKALKESEAKYRELVQNANSIIARFDTNGNFTFFNEYAEKFFGYTEKEIIGKNAVGTILPATDTLGRDLASLISNITRNPDRYATFENENMLRNGQRVWVAWTNKAIYDRKGAVTEILCIGNDITERKRLEKQLQQAQKMESIGTLAGGIAHDFNNILTSVIGYTELALDGLEKGSQLESNLQEVYKAGKRARDLVKQILTFARQADEKIKPVSVKKIGVEALKLLRASIPSNIEISQHIESESLIMGDRTQVHQIFMNLCTNAAQAMEDRGGVLQVGLTDANADTEPVKATAKLKPGSYIKLWVSDTGAGIPPDIVESVFEPYYTTKAPGEGTGMGLAMVHGIVERYGGKIEVDSELGKGTVFTVYLPSAETRQLQSSYVSEELSSGRERILFIDDEEPIAKMGSQILERLGYSVTTRTSSVEALELFRAKPDDFDLVISDMTMPNMTGDELAMELIALRSDIPVVLCTGYSKKITNEKAAKIGIKAVAYKPIVMADLAKTVRKVLDEAKEFHRKPADGLQSTP